MEYEDLETLPHREGLGKYAGEYDRTKIRGRSGAKENTSHNSTKYKLIRRIYTKAKLKLKNKISRDNFSSLEIKSST